MTDSDFGERRLSAVLHADIAGYSRLIGLNDVGTLRRLRTLRQDLIDPTVGTFRGRVVNTAGDAFLIVFNSVEGAVQCALNLQREIPIHDGDQAPERRIRLRIGITVADVIADGTDVHGDGVNIAARLQSVCVVGGICVSRMVRDHVQGRLNLNFDPLGPLVLKNIAQPVEAFALKIDANALIPATAVRRHGRNLMFAVLGMCLIAAGGAGWWLRRDTVPVLPAPSAPAFVSPDIGLARAPRLSLVVLPFNNLSGDTLQDYLADGITEDLTSDLARIPGMLVIARNSAFTYKGRSIDVKRIGEELGVRYLVQGSVRRIGETVRVSTQLVSTETGAYVGDGDRIDRNIAELASGQDEVVARIGRAMNIQLTVIESARGTLERPKNPNAFDLILQARVLRNRPPSPERGNQELKYYEQALEIDRSSIEAKLGVAAILIGRASYVAGLWVTAEDLVLADRLINEVQAVTPDYEGVLAIRIQLLQAREQWEEILPAAERLIDAYPNNASGHLMRAQALRYAGRSEEALPRYMESLRLNPLDPDRYLTYGNVGLTLMILQRYGESAEWFEKSLMANPDAPVAIRALRTYLLAAVYASAGLPERASVALAKAQLLWPYTTVRFIAPETRNPTYIAQLAQIRDEWARVGVRDHADEDEDRGVPSDKELHAELFGYTPTSVSGATTIRTGDLRTFLVDRKPVVIDTMLRYNGASIPGAVGLKQAGLGGSLSDTTQQRLNKQMQALTAGDLRTPVVVVGFNSESFDGRNLTLRLIALGYKDVYWYRGGREAWEVQELPETPADVQVW